MNSYSIPGRHTDEQVSGTMNVFSGALNLLLTGDREVWLIIGTSLRFSLTAIVISTLISIPSGLFIALRKFPGRRTLLVILNSLMALPTVVVGLLVFSVLSRSGPLGHYAMLFTPRAIMAGQVILSFPLITSLVYSALSRIEPELKETLVSLGFPRWKIPLIILSEQRIAVMQAVIAGFGRVIGEVGVSMMLGGNIRWYTRTITTSIALETGKGNFELAMSLGIVLLLVSLGVNFILHMGVGYE